MSGPPQIWFEMLDIRRRRLANSVWIPLRLARTSPLPFAATSDNGVISGEELYFVGSVAFPPKNRDEAEELGWSDIGIGHAGGPYAYKSSYKPCEVYQHNDEEDLGIDFVFEQYVGAGQEPVWHLSQDLVIALGLVREGNTWVRPREGYIDVVREEVDNDGKIVGFLIRNDFLRDYLAARGLSLRVAIYRRRQAILEDASHIGWATTGLTEHQPHDRFEARVFQTTPEGWLPGSVAVFQSWRTDVDEGDEIPVFGRDDDSNTDGRSFQFERKGKTVDRVEGELWREEWIEPASRSTRVRGDDPETYLDFIVDGAANRMSARDLNKEDIGRYLWFNHTVILELLGKRGASLRWYTADTGSIDCSPDYPVHFGVNQLGLINVYACDIARLPQWQQRIWAGKNVSPDGGVSAELLASQMRSRPAKTVAPETALFAEMQALGEVFRDRFGVSLFREHHAAGEISETLHRFRATDTSSLLSLAKDIARLTADRIDAVAIRQVIGKSEEKLGSLKSLERLLGSYVSAGDANDLHP